MTTRSSLKQPHTVDYSQIEPLPDPTREPDMNQRTTNSAFDGTLIPYFANRGDVLVCGEGYLRQEATNDAERLSPDGVVAYGVDPKAIVARNGYVISEVGKPPDFVLEVASRSTGRRDYTVKRDGYAGYGVREYWRFDHTGGSPDGVVAYGVDPKAIVARNGYVISEVGKPPDFVLEVASRSTGRRDYTVKRDGYAGYGVREYWRFDHTGGRFHDAALAGDVLVDGRYEPLEIIHEPDGLIWGHSEVLGLDLCWRDGELRFRDPLTGGFLPTPEEQQTARIEAETHAEQEHAARIEAETRAEQEHAARIAQPVGVV